MARLRKERAPTASEQLEALLGHPWPFRGRPLKHDLSTWIVTDDWPEHGRQGHYLSPEREVGLYAQISPIVKPSVKGSSLSRTIVFNPKIQLVPDRVGTTAERSPILASSTRRPV